MDFLNLPVEHQYMSSRALKELFNPPNTLLRGFYSDSILWVHADVPVLNDDGTNMSKCPRTSCWTSIICQDACLGCPGALTSAVNMDVNILKGIFKGRFMICVL